MLDPMLHRDLGKLEGRLSALESDIKDTRNDIKEIYRLMRHVNKQLDAAGGSWKFMMGIATISAAATAVLMNIKKLVGLN